MELDIYELLEKFKSDPPAPLPPAEIFEKMIFETIRRFEEEEGWCDGDNE